MSIWDMDAMVSNHQFAGLKARIAPSAVFEQIKRVSTEPMYSVLQVTPALDAGGVERTTIEVAEAIAKAGGRAVVASRGGRMEAELAAVGGEWAPLPLDTKNPITMIDNARKLVSVARRNDIRLIHARSRAPAWSALAAARALKAPFVTTYHGVYNARSPLKKFYNSVMARGDIVIANSHFTRAHVIETHAIPAERVVAIPRGVDLERFDPETVSQQRRDAMRAMWGLAPDDPRCIVLLPARLTRWKGQIQFVEAAAKAEAASPGRALYVMAGDAQGRTDYVRELTDLAQARGLGACVKLVGHLTDMPAALAISTVAVFPSLDPEAFGRAAVEAQAMAVPVIAAGHGGLAETIRNGSTGFHVTPGDVEDLAQAMHKVLDMDANARRIVGGAAQAHARATYSVRALQTATLNVYARLLEAQK
jgi:glycosyltransferase involved in cell wall biosynthesis